MATTTSRSDRAPASGPARVAGWVLPAASGVVAAAALPRGPVTGTQLAVLLGALLLTGGVAGRLAGTRWIVVAAPALHLAGWELGRATVFRLDGPTFDRPSFGTTMGVLLFAAVHVLYALVTGPALALGAVAGRSPRRAAVWSAAGVVVVVATGLLLAPPSRVEPVGGGVAALEKVRLGGVDQWVSLRGASAANPVLLHLSGGPGSSDVGWVRTFNAPLEEHFTVVVWEQRGAGRSYPALDPADRLTLDQLISDGVELTEWLMRRFGTGPVLLTGNSWGSTLGVLMAQRRPELFAAFVGTGQMVSQRETDRILYRQLGEHAARTGDRRLRDRLAAAGEPPYRHVLDYAMVMEYYDVIEPYRHVPAFDEARGPRGFFPAEYHLLDTWNEIRGFADMGGLLYPQLQDIDFRRDVPRLEVPVYVVQGRHELTARSGPAGQWLAGLRAPVKRVYVFENSGHNADAEEPERYNELLVGTVLPEASRPRPIGKD